MLMTPEEEYAHHFKKMNEICVAQNWGDPFSYARSKEILAANALGHKVADTFSGADAFNQDGKPVEYKSTTAKKVKGSYTGISVHSTWEDQEKYLREDKIGKYEQHYFNRFDNGRLVESWVMSGQDVLNVLLPKLRNKFSTVLLKKDPRLSANITNSDIKYFGKRVL